MNNSEIKVVAALLARTYWREGDPVTRLDGAIVQAKRRANREVYSGDPELDRKIAKLGKRVRKVLV